MISQMLNQLSNTSYETEQVGIHCQWVCFQGCRDLAWTGTLIESNTHKSLPNVLKMKKCIWI